MDRTFRGLPGLNTISDQERQQFMLDNEDKLRKYRTAGQRRKAAEVLYNNIQFRNAFGDEGFEEAKAAGYDLDMRNQLLENKIISDKAKEVFGSDNDFQSLASQLDIQGWRDLINSDYLGTEERKRRLQSGIESSKEVAKSYDAAINNPYTDALGAGFMQIGKTAAELSPYEQDEEYAKNDKEIRDRIFAETQERREAEIQGVANSIYDSMVESDARGEKSLSDFYSEFDNMASGKDADGVSYSPHYATFKNSKWLEDYSHEDRLRDYAKYQALKSQYGESVARQYLDRSIQNRVAEAQDGAWTGNTAKKVFTTIWSDLGSNIALFNNIGKSPEEIGILNEGKDPSKPIYDESGNIVDYERNDAMWTNPAYWNNVYKYNTFSPEEIKTIEERGGISEDVNIREYGHTPDFFSWETAQEGFGQVGHFAAFGIESYLTGGAGKLVGLSGKAALKAMGLGAKGLAKASRVGNITNDLFVTFAGGASGAQMEAMGTFDEQMQSAKERIEEQKKQELKEYYDSIDYSSSESQTAINQFYEQLKKQDKRRVATESIEGKTALPLSDEILRNQAKQLYTNQLLDAKSKELEELHKSDLDEARRAATKAYGTNFFLDWIKDAPFDLALRKFQYAKGSMTGAFDNAIEKNIVADATTGGVKRAGKVFTSPKNVAKEIGKQIGGGFADEYMDGLNASFASGIGNHDFENYINKTYNPELYNAATEGFLGSMIAGLSDEIDGITDRNNLYEGFIGAIAPGTSVMINPNVAFHPQDTWKAVMKGEDAVGNKITFAERLSGALMNPLINTYAELVAKDREIDSSVEMINQVIASRKDDLGNSAKILSTLNDYSSPLKSYKFTDEKEDNKEILEESPSLLDSQDQKLYNAFTLMETLSTLEKIPGGNNSALYQESMNVIQGLADGSLSEEKKAEEIDRFLASPENKSIIDNPQNREIAAERLQKNAQFLLDTKQKIEETRAMFDRSAAMKDVDPRVKTLLTYNIVAKDDYKQRLEELENQFGETSHTNPDALYTPDYAARYGTVKAAERAVTSRERMLKSLQKEKEEVKQQIEEAKKKGQEELVKSRQFQLTSINEKEQLLQDEKKAISDLIASTTESEETKKNSNAETTQFTEKSILSLDARDRAAVLDVANTDNYSKGQQKVIDHVRRKLMQQDPEALQKVKDAGVLAERISDLNTVQDKLMQNSQLAATYLNTVEQLRNTTAMTESLQKGVEQHFGKIEKAYNNLYNKKPRNPEKRQQEFKDAVMATNRQVLEAYMNDHPDQADKIQPLYDLLKFDEDAAAVIAASEAPAEVKMSQLQTLWDMNTKVNNRDEAIAYIEGIVDSPDVAEPIKEQFDNLLTDLENIGYQRDATIIESRKQRKEREATDVQKKNESEEDVKVIISEATKKAADIKAAQEQITGDEQTGEDAIPLETNTIINEDTSSAEQRGQVSDEFLTFDEEGNSQVENNKEGKGSVNNNVESNHIIDNGDSIQGESATINEQMAEPNAEGSKEVHSSEESQDYATQNGIGEHIIETSATSISANAMSEWKPEPLQTIGKLEHKQGSKPDDSMSRYYAWMESEGIKLQNIIDEELGQILRKNPHAKVKFLIVKPDYNATHDDAMRTHFLLALDYDGSINKGITSIHNKDNGGVLESNGKQYLVIGTAGFGSNNADKLLLYDILFSKSANGPAGIGLAKRGSGEFFRTHPSERFFVREDLSTEVVPMSLIPGYIVKQLEKDETPQYRSIKELLSDSERNPQGLELQDLSFGIQEKTQFLVVGTSLDRVMIPRKPEANNGTAFVLIPASNGKMVPSYLKPLFFNEMKNGELKDEIMKQIDGVVSPRYADRVQAVINLTNIFYMNKDGEFILVGKDNGPLQNKISLVKDGTVFKTFELNENFDRQQFLEAFSEMNPRVNITKSVLQSVVQLQRYDEAGALQTDAARLTTAGSSYSIYGLNTNGEMLIPETVENDIPQVEKNSGFRNADKRQIPFRHQYYTFDKNEDKFYVNGVPVTDEVLINQLKVNLRINEAGLSPVESQGSWKTYILSEGDHPEVVKVHRNTKEVKQLLEQEAQQLIDKISHEKVEKERAEAAKKALKEQQPTNVVEINLYEDNMAVDEETGELIPIAEAQQKQAELEEKKEGEVEAPAEQQGQNQDSFTHRSVESLEATEGKAATQKFSDLIKDRKYMMPIYQIIKNKWPEAPSKIDDLTQFLSQKGVNVDMIGTSEADIDAWIRTLRDCR